jgi:two-component system, chemotaxis family, CheB/CheR fusion protein
MVDGDDVAGETTAANDPGFQALLEKLSDTYKFDFREYKAASLMRRLRARMSQVHADSFEAYAQYLNAHPEEHVTLFNTILINVTGFFRDAEAWTALAEEIIPRIVADAADTRSIRIWSAGCASGEETYSLAILLAEHLGNRASEFQVKIYGTDVDEDALAAARHALYRTEQIKDVPDHLLARYFLRDGQLWRLRRDIRRWCIFGAHNLAQSPPLSHVDLLVCRNVLIYFTASLQDRIISRFHYSVRDGGFMFLGRSESLLARSKLFAGVNLKWRIFQRIPSSIRGELPLTLPDGPAHSAEPYERAAPGRERVQRTLEALPSPVIVVDPVDTVLTWNPAAEALFEIPSVHAMGRNFRDLDVSYRVEGLRARLEDVKIRQGISRMDGITFTRRGGELVHANILIAPLFDASHFTGVLISVENATEHSRLKEQMMRIAEQHATAIEELQSTNEELETTNEELQSTNEELETTNEELQSTNEELETTVEELQAANAELAALNAELEDRGIELARLDTYHRGVVNSAEQGMVVMDKLGVVRTWNHAAERMWGLRSEQVVGRDFFSLPLAALVQLARPAFQRMLATGEVQQFDRVPYTIPGGAERLGRLRLVPITDGGGEISGGVASVWPQDGR